MPLLDLLANDSAVLFGDKRDLQCNPTVGPEKKQGEALRKSRFNRKRFWTQKTVQHCALSALR